MQFPFVVLITYHGDAEKHNRKTSKFPVPQSSIIPLVSQVIQYQEALIQAWAQIQPNVFKPKYVQRYKIPGLKLVFFFVWRYSYMQRPTVKCRK